MQKQKIILSMEAFKGAAAPAGDSSVEGTALYDISKIFQKYFITLSEDVNS